LLAIFNWDNKKYNKNIPLERFGLDGEYFVRSFWDGATDAARGGVLPLKGIPPHGVKLLALRKAPPQSPPIPEGKDGTLTPAPSPIGRGESLYLGSDLHISQGLEATRFIVADNSLELELTRPGHAQGQIDLYLPHPPREASLNSLPVAWQSLPGQVYRFGVDFHNQAKLKIQM